MILNYFKIVSFLLLKVIAIHFCQSQDLEISYDQLQQENKSLIYSHVFDKAYGKTSNGKVKDGKLTLSKGRSDLLRLGDVTTLPANYEVEIAMKSLGRIYLRSQPPYEVVNYFQISLSNSDISVTWKDYSYEKRSYLTRSKSFKINESPESGALLTIRKLGHLLYIYFNKSHVVSIDAKDFSPAFSLQRGVHVASYSFSQFQIEKFEISQIRNTSNLIDDQLSNQQSTNRRALLGRIMEDFLFDRETINQSIEQFASLNNQDPLLLAWMDYFKTQFAEYELREKNKENSLLDRSINEPIQSYVYERAIEGNAECLLLSYLMNDVSDRLSKKKNEPVLSFSNLDDSVFFSTMLGSIHLVKFRGVSPYPRVLNIHGREAEYANGKYWNQTKSIFSISENLKRFSEMESENNLITLLKAYTQIESENWAALNGLLNQIKTQSFQEDILKHFEVYLSINLYQNFNALGHVYSSLPENLIRHNTRMFAEAFLKSNAPLKIPVDFSYDSVFYFYDNEVELGKYLIAAKLDRDQSSQEYLKACQCNWGKRRNDDFAKILRSRDEKIWKYSNVEEIMLVRNFFGGIARLAKKSCDYAIYLKNAEQFFRLGLQWHEKKEQKKAMVFFKYAHELGHQKASEFYEWNAKNTYTVRKYIRTDTRYTREERPSGTIEGGSSSRYVTKKQYIMVQRPERVDIKTSDFPVYYLLAWHHKKPQNFFDILDLDYLADGAEAFFKGDREGFGLPADLSVEYYKEDMHKFLASVQSSN